MKKAVFVIICIAAILATIYMGATCWWATQRDASIWQVAIRIAATIGWVIITQRIITKKDKWIRKTFK